jgi:hypothetical protein
MTEPTQCPAKLVANNAGYSHEIYCTRNAGHPGPHRGDTVWLDRAAADPVYVAPH